MLVMAQKSKWKCGHSFKWITQLPFLDASQDSPAFVLQNKEYYLHFSLCRNGKGRYYEIELKRTEKTTSKTFTPFQFSMYALIGRLGYRRSYFAEITIGDGDTIIWSKNQRDLQKEVEPNFLQSTFARFVFASDVFMGPKSQTSDDLSGKY